MKNMVRVWLVVLAIGILVASNVTAQETQKQTSNKVELQRLYVSYLIEEGYKPEVDDDGDVRFKQEGKLYFISINEKDPEFFRIVLANIWPIESELERVQVLIAADASNSKSKVSKVFTVKDNVWVCIELFLGSPEQFKAVFKRAMSALENGVVNFANKMRE